MLEREAAPVRLGELGECLGGGRLQLLAADLGEHVAELVVRLSHRVVRAQVLAHAVHEALVKARGALELLQPSHHTVCTHAITRFSAIYSYSYLTTWPKVFQVTIDRVRCG